MKAGFVVCDGGDPVTFELHDDIAAGTHIDEPVPIFKDQSDAEEAARQYAGLHGHEGEDSKFEIRAVTLTIGDIVAITELTDDEESED